MASFVSLPTFTIAILLPSSGYYFPRFEHKVWVKKYFRKEAISLFSSKNIAIDYLGFNGENHLASGTFCKGKAVCLLVVHIIDVIPASCKAESNSCMIKFARRALKKSKDCIILDSSKSGHTNRRVIQLYIKNEVGHKSHQKANNNLTRKVTIAR